MDIDGSLNCSDEQLACRAQAGCAAALEALVRRYDAPLKRYLRRRLGAHDAEDVAQETLLKAMRNLHRYDPGRPFSAWLYTIAMRLAISLLRGRREGLVESIEKAAEDDLPADAAGTAGAAGGDEDATDADSREGAAAPGAEAFGELRGRGKALPRQ